MQTPPHTLQRTHARTKTQTHAHTRTHTGPWPRRVLRRVQRRGWKRCVILCRGFRLEEARASNSRRGRITVRPGSASELTRLVGVTVSFSPKAVYVNICRVRIFSMGMCLREPARVLTRSAVEAIRPRRGADLLQDSDIKGSLTQIKG